MNRLATLLLAVPLSWMLAPGRCNASLGTPVSVELVGEPRFAAPGVAFPGTIRVVTDTTITLSGFHFEGDTWTTLSLEAPPTVLAVAGQPLDIPFEIISPTPENWIHFVFDFGETGNSFPIGTPFDVSFRSYWKGSRDGEVIEIEPPVPGQTRIYNSRGHELPGPAPSSETQVQTISSGSIRTIRVTGTFVYRRDDGQWAGTDGITVSVYDDDGLEPSDLLAAQVTDSEGYFDISFTWDPSGLQENDPDLYLKFKAENDRVDLQHYIWDKTYTWKTSETENFTGTLKEYGTIGPSDEDDYPGLHVLSTMTRVWRWYKQRAGYTVPSVNVKWPYGNTSNDFYWAGTGTIHISPDGEWDEGTQAHEYGHHWLQSFSFQPDVPDYWNDYCDGGIFSPGHCTWCEENEEVAWSEGFSDWLGYKIPLSFEGDYGLPPVSPTEGEYENPPSSCTDSDGNPCSCDPWVTEGFFAALLRDMNDTNNEDSDGDGIADVLSLSKSYLFEVADLDEPRSPAEFLDAFRARFTGYCPQLWPTAYNVGYQIDDDRPDVVLIYDSSTSHDIGVSSPDPTIDFLWATSWDDCSGVVGYSIRLSSAGPAPPDYTMDDPGGGAINLYTTDTLSPGTYYLNARAVDQAGRWSMWYGTDGPYIIRSPQPANLEFNARTGWDYVVVPRATSDATGSFAPLPSSLNTSATYWNASYANSGDSSTVAMFTVGVFVDGINQDFSLRPALGGLTSAAVTNEGPFAVQSGRHTLGVRLDGGDVIAEGDETDNVWAHQWTWEPHQLTAGTGTVRSAPPDPEGGWDWIVDGSSKWYNCDGLRMVCEPGWNAVTVYAIGDSADYDCRLHGSAAGAGDSTAFASPIKWSARGLGRLDAVLVNKYKYTNPFFNVGVINLNEGASPYSANHVASDSLTLGDSVVVSLGAMEMMALQDIYIDPFTAGVTVQVEVDSASGPIYAIWMDKDTTTAALSDFTPVSTGRLGEATFNVEGLSAGNYGLAIFRDPKEASGAVDVGIQTWSRRVSLGWAASVPGWHGSLVPRPDPDGSFQSVPLPDTLFGNADSTWLNFAFENQSLTTGDSIAITLYVDGLPSSNIDGGTIGPYTTKLVNWAYPVFVSGGRHSLSARVDETSNPDLEPNDNLTGEQFVWSPVLLAPGVPRTRAAPPAITGGWGHLGAGDLLRYNCDGLRIPSPLGGTWRAVAALPDSAGNVDLRLHEAMPGTKDGFGALLALSAWGVEECDYVAVNMAMSAEAPYDVGVLQAGDRTAGYTAEVVSSVFRGTSPQGVFGPFTLSGDRILDLHEFILAEGFYAIELVNVSGTIDWGMALHSDELPYHSRSSAVDRGASWFGGPGGREIVIVSVEDTVSTCLAVFKAHSSDLGSSGQYKLVFTWSPTAVEDDGPMPTPTAVTLSAIRPNPFQTGTVVDYYLPQASPVAFRIFTTEGRLVRRLEMGSLPPGWHEAIWDGRDRYGRPAASGVYWISLNTKHKTLARKIVKLH